MPAELSLFLCTTLMCKGSFTDLCRVLWLLCAVVQTSWEAEEHLPEDLIALFQAQNPELFAERTDAAAAAGRAWSSDYETQFASRSQPGTSSSSSSSNGDVLSSAPEQPANDQKHTSNGHGSSSSSSNGAVAMAVHQGQDAAGAGVPTAAGAAAAAAGNGSGGLAGHSGMEGCTGMEGSVAAVAGSSSATAEQKVAAMV